MQRHSARLHQQPPKSLAEDDFVPEDPEDVAQEEEHDDAAVEKPKRKKRKTDAGGGGGQPLPKKPRGKRGLLQKVVEMPLDLLFEIFGRLEPADLLNLARTSKDLRALLMSRSSSSIWKAARANVPGLPECPDDLSEPRYADLMFGKNCHLCSRSVSSLHYCWGSRIRACTRCIEESGRFQKSDRGPRSFYALDGRVQPPSVIINKAGRRYYRPIKYYDTTIDAAWQAEYQAAEDKRQWITNKAEERKIITEHAGACDVWLQNMQSRRQQEKESVIDERKAAIVEYVKQLGWADELSKMGQRGGKIEDLGVVVKACKKNITKQVLADMKDALVEFMESRKKARLAEERSTLLSRRLRKLKSIIESTLPVNTLHPNTGELFRNPIIRDMVYDESSHESLDSVRSMLPDLTVQWKKDIDEQLLNMIKSARPDYAFNPNTVLDLATTFFYCNECRNSYIKYPRVLMHSCAIRPGYTNVSDKTSDQFVLVEAIKETFWNGLRRIEYRPNDVKAMTEVIEMAGFDPATTTTAEMDSANPIFECIACNNETDGRLTLNWTMAAAHRLQSHYGKLMEMVLLKEEEAAIVRPRMVEEMERERNRSYASNYICVHCRQENSYSQLKKHVKNEHGKSTVTAEDVVLRIDARSEVPRFRLWPPREE